MMRLWRYLSLTFISIYILTGCTVETVEFAPGLAKFDAGQYHEAMQIFQKVANSKDSHANRARFYMGECYKYSSEWDNAIKEFETVLAAEPPRSYLTLQAKEMIEQIRTGLRDIERLSILCAENPGTEMEADALMEKGSVYENKLNNYDKAIRAYSEVVEKFPGTAKAAQAQINIGKIYFYRLYDYDSGWQEFRKVNKGNYPEQTDKVKEVEDLLFETEKILREIKTNVEFIKRAQEKEKLAWKNYAGIQMPQDVRIIRDQINESFIAIARRWRQIKNYPKALEIYRTDIKGQPFMLRHVALTRYNIGETYQEWGKCLEAIDAYYEYIKFFPTHFMRPKGDYNMAICYEATQNYEKAYETYKIYCDSYPDGEYFGLAKLKYLKYGSDEDHDGFPCFMELMAGTSDTDPNEYPK